MSRKETYYRYNHSVKGKTRKRRYELTHPAELAEAQRKRYHRKQDEAGCHQKPRTFYPVFRFLEALETAEVVEIKEDY